MKRKISIYHFLVALMLSTLLLPAFVGATASEGPTGSLTIHKFEQDPEKGQSPGETGDGNKLNPNPEGKPLEGVEFTLTQTHKYNPDTDKWTEVTGTAKSYKEKTDSSGKIVIDNIDLGRYEVQETDGPPHVNRNTDKFHVDIPMTNAEGTELNYDVHIYPKNETIRGAVVLHKVDGEKCPPPAPRSLAGETEAKECEGLEGVTFDLYDQTGLLSAGHTTDGSGKIKINGLAYGSYYFKEVEAANGYLSGSDIHFNITETGSIDEDGTRAGTVVDVTARNFTEPGVEKTVNETAVNRGEEVTYTITVDLPADIKSYKNFVITDELDENLEFVSAEDATGFKFGKDGQTLTWTGNPTELEPGKTGISFTAKVKESAPANKGIDNIATIDYTNNYDSTGEKETDPVTVTPTVGKVVVIKQDGDTKERLKGAEFVLQDEDGNAVYGPLTTNSKGEIEFGEVDYGTYELVETKAPKGYSKLNNSIEVVVNEDQSEHEITVDNYEKADGWELPKTGGIGTMLFTFIGLSLMGGASYMFARRRKDEQEA